MYGLSIYTMTNKVKRGLVGSSEIFHEAFCFKIW